MKLQVGLAMAACVIGITTDVAHAQDAGGQGVLVVRAAKAQFFDGPEAARSVSVPIADLDLAKAAGRATMDRRVRQAVRVVCPGKGLMSLTQMLEVRSCAKVARAGAKGPMLLAIGKAEQRLAARTQALAAR